MTSLVRSVAKEWSRDLVLNVAISSPLLPSRVRWLALRGAGFDVAKSRIMPRGFFGGPNVRIGRGAFINYECFFDTYGHIDIGAYTYIGMRVTFVSSSHEVGPSSRRAGANKSAPIVVGAGCWIGASSTILPGVTIGEGTIIAAGAVVTKDCDPNSLYAGVPARKVRALKESEPRAAETSAFA